jgi:hypothetical protein
VGLAAATPAPSTVTLAGRAASTAGISAGECYLEVRLPVASAGMQGREGMDGGGAPVEEGDGRGRGTSASASRLHARRMRPPPLAPSIREGGVGRWGRQGERAAPPAAGAERRGWAQGRRRRQSRGRRSRG